LVLEFNAAGGGPTINGVEERRSTMHALFFTLAILTGISAIYGAGVVSGIDMERDRAIRAAGGFYYQHRDGQPLLVWIIPCVLGMLSGLLAFFAA
jgi:hypothetical protein